MVKFNTVHMLIKGHIPIPLSTGWCYYKVITLHKKYIFSTYLLTNQSSALRNEVSRTDFQMKISTTVIYTCIQKLK